MSRGGRIYRLGRDAAFDFPQLWFDKLTYASNLESLAPVKHHPRYRFVRADVADAKTIRVANFRSDVIMHLAAESHVDRSIDGPAAFIQTNVVGTFVAAAGTRVLP